MKRINWKEIFSRRNLIFIGIFAVLGLIAMQFSVNVLVGSKVNLTFFDMIGPMASGFIGTIPGIISVALMQIANFFLHGADVVDAGTVIRWFPMLFAAWYFGRKTQFNWIIPALAMVAFNLHPIGRSAWQYSLFWLIPIACYFWRDRFILARTLGTTFTAHAVGSTLWVWVFGLTKEVWLGLIPVVMIERGMFAIGMAVGYLVLNNVLNVLVNKKVVPFAGLVNKRFVWKWADNL
jgi:hypothetical protein